MDRDRALGEVSGIGLSYFWDADAKLSNAEIIAEIEEHIRGTLKLTGLGMWKTRQSALQTVLAECSEEELDQIVIRDYNLPLIYVDGRGRNLLERLQHSISTSIQETEQTLKSR